MQCFYCFFSATFYVQIKGIESDFEKNGMDF